MVTSFLNRFAPIDFTRYIDRLTDRFTGREWLFENHIEPWLENNGNEQFYLLTGEPGVGKSAIVAELIKRWQTQPEKEKQGKLAAYHFCRAGDVETVRPGRVLRSIAAQLGETLPHYGKALKKVLKQVHLNINVNINIEELSNSRVTGIYIENLKDLDPREELRLLIQAPLATLPEIYKNLPEEEQATLPTLKVFLIDSLDEAVTTTGRDNVATLLAALSQANDLPPWIRFILTARPGILKARLGSDTALQFQSLKHYELEKNLTDIERYVTRRVQEDIERPQAAFTLLWQGYRELQKGQTVESEKLSLWLIRFAAHLVTRSNQSKFNFQARLEQAQRSSEALVQEVRDLSKGNFLYTRLVMDGISTGELSLKNLSALPKNLNEVYQRFLRHRCSVRKWINLYQPLLGTLTVTQEAISSAQLAKFAKVASDPVEGVPQVESAIAILQQFLDEVENDEGQKLYTIFHQSLREYLLDKKHNQDFWCDAKEQHDSVIDCFKNESEGWEDLRAIDLYGLRHLAQHLVKGDRTEKLHSLLSLEKDENNTWFAVKDERGDLSGLLTDVQLAWAEADRKFEEEPSRAFGWQCRYSLLTLTVSKLVNDLPMSLLVAAVRENVWTVERALGYALSSNVGAKIEDTVSSKVEKVLSLADLLPEVLKQQALQVCLSGIQVVDDAFARARLLTRLLEKFPQVFALADVTVQSIQDEWHHTCALNALSEKSLQLSDQALKAIQAVTHGQLSDQALKAIQAVTHGRKRGSYLKGSRSGSFLIPLVERLSEGFPCDALASAYAIQFGFGNFSYTDVLERLAKRFPEVLPQVLDTVQAIQFQSKDIIVYRTGVESMDGDRYAAEMIEKLAQWLPQNLLSHVLEIALSSEDSVSSAIALTALAKKFPQVVPQALDAIQEIPGEWGGENLFDRSLFLVQIVEQIPEDLLSKALKITQEIKQGGERTFAMVRLAKKFPQLLPQTLDEVRKTSKEIRENSAYFLTELAEIFPEVLPKALNAIRTLPNKAEFAESLIKVAGNFPQALPETLEVIKKIQEKSVRDLRLKELAQTCPGQLSEALKQVRRIDDERDSLEVSAKLAKQWYKLGGELPPTLYLVLTLEHRLENLGSCFNLARKEMQKIVFSPRSISSLNKALHKIEKRFEFNSVEQANALAALVEQLPDEPSPQTVSTVMEKINCSPYYEIPLIALTRKCPRLLPTALNAIQKHEDNASSFQQNYVSKEWKPHTLDGSGKPTIYGANLLSRLAEKFPQVAIQALSAVQSIQRMDLYEIAYEERVVECLVSIAKSLPKDLLFQFLDAIQAISDDELRSRVLESLACRLVELQRTDAVPIWQAILHEFSFHRTRPLLLRNLATLAPVISTLGGKEALGYLSLEIAAITRCYP